MEQSRGHSDSQYHSIFHLCSQTVSKTTVELEKRKSWCGISLLIEHPVIGTNMRVSNISTLRMKNVRKCIVTLRSDCWNRAIIPHSACYRLGTNSPWSRALIRKFSMMPNIAQTMPRTTATYQVTLFFKTWKAEQNHRARNPPDFTRCITLQYRIELRFCQDAGKQLSCGVHIE